MLYKDIADHTARDRAQRRERFRGAHDLQFGSLNWTRTYIHGVTRNPWNLERTPGGSSGGSAAAVAVGMMPICTGSDGGGSIRTPSAYSGLFGFKVSFGRVGDAGDFDCGLTSVPGPICRSVRDAARYVDAIAGPTDIDPTSLPRPVRSYEDAVFSGAAAQRLHGLRAAWSSTLGFAVCDPEVEKRAHEAALALAEDAGIEMVDVDFKFPQPSKAWSILTNIDVSAKHLAAYRGSDEQVTPVSKADFEIISHLTSGDLLMAQQRRWELLRAVADVFAHVDLVFTPTTATTAFAAEGPPPLEIAGQSVGGMGSVPYGAPFNISGMPAVSIPAGTSADGMPVGLQVAARRSEEELVLACGALAETNRPWPKFAPMAYT
jgi:aspartyl-tRNA(Asn)/glutamyl-tRNA(Gln) amidotransferase subunit A